MWHETEALQSLHRVSQVWDEHDLAVRALESASNGLITLVTAPCLSQRIEVFSAESRRQSLVVLALPWMARKPCCFLHHLPQVEGPKVPQW